MKLTLPNGINLDLTPEQVEALKQQLNKPTVQKRWRAKHDGKYWKCNWRGEVTASIECGDSFDTFNYETGNYFQTEAEAQHHLDTEIPKIKALVRIKDYIRENGLSFEPDWENHDQRKYVIQYSHRYNKFFRDEHTFIQEYANFHFKSPRDAEQVIEHCLADLKIVFGIKE